MPDLAGFEVRACIHACRLPSNFDVNANAAVDRAACLVSRRRAAQAVRVVQDAAEQGHPGHCGRPCASHIAVDRVCVWWESVHRRRRTPVCLPARARFRRPTIILLVQAPPTTPPHARGRTAVTCAKSYHCYACACRAVSRTPARRGRCRHGSPVSRACAADNPRQTHAPQLRDVRAQRQHHMDRSRQFSGAAAAVQVSGQQQVWRELPRLAYSLPLARPDTARDVGSPPSRPRVQDARSCLFGAAIRCRENRG